MKEKLKYFLGHFFGCYISNNIIAKIPSWTVRKSWYRLIGVKIGKYSHIDMNVYILGARKLSIGEYVHVNQGTFLDARGGLVIEDNVSLSHFCRIVTGGHDYNSSDFEGKFIPIKIKEYCWLGIGATILQGVSLGKGSVIGANCVVTKDTEEYHIYMGNPARKVKSRNNYLTYHPLAGENHFRFL